MAPVAPSVLRRAVAVLVAVSAAALLASCVEAPDEEPTSMPTPSATPSGTPAPQPTLEPGEETVPIDTACTDLVDPDTMYAFNPNFALLGSFTPDAGSAAEAALAADGVACRWVTETGGTTMDLSIAHLPEATLTQLKNDAYASSQMVPTYGDEAYFDPATGTAVVFQGPYWLVLTSVAFAEPGEPTPIIESALAALPAA